MNTLMEGEFYCSSCDKKQPHRFVYIGHPTKGEIYLKKIVCLKCKNALSMDRLEILDSYFRKMPKRILSKFFRILEEAAEDPFVFLKDAPIRYLTKPYRMAQEIFEITRKE